MTIGSTSARTFFAKMLAAAMAVATPNAFIVDVVMNLLVLLIGEKPAIPKIRDERSF
jgi:hypothetical protein